MIESAVYANAEETAVHATVDGVPYSGIWLNQETDLAEHINAWIAAGGTLAAFTPPAPAPSFLARELMALLGADDYAAIQAAVAQSPALGLLWASLLAQGDAPIFTDAERFQAGWTGLTTALGLERADELAAALGF